MHQTIHKTKVFYRPIEAGIRWAALLHEEQVILTCAPSHRTLPSSLDCSRRPELQLYLDRIYDGIDNGELPYGRDGITTNDTALLDSPELTVRHVDLKDWMRRYYPEHRPCFLFSRSERIVHPTITLEAGQAMLVERQAMQVELAQYRHKIERLSRDAAVHPSGISRRAETTYLNIIGAMLELMLECSPSGRRYSSFDTQEAIISALVAHHGDRMGISERTMHGKFAKARKTLQSTLA